jgi:hypothetical protein
MLFGLLASAMLFMAPMAAEDRMVLDVRSQLDGSRYALANCGPTALSMALGYYGVDSSLWDLRVRAMKAQKSWVDDDGGYSDDYGVFAYNLATVAESMGVRVSGLWQREGARTGSPREWRADDLRAAVRARQPVIVQVAFRAMPGRAGSSYRSDHFIVVHGVEGDQFVYSDPLDDKSGGPGLKIGAAELERAMSLAAVPRVGFAIYPKS